MIQSFHCRDTERLFNGERVKRFVNIENVARRKLGFVHFATDLCDLLIPASTRMEKLAGDRAGQYSIRINDQFRVCLNWNEGNARNVEIVDYH